MTPEKAKAFLTADLKGEGFDDVRIARADSIPQVPERLHAFLEAGRHGTMGWMKETAERRADPRKLWPDAQSVVLAAMNYGPEDSDEPLNALERRDRATISVYARNRDYHDVIKGRLKQAAGRFAARTGRQVKVFIDTAPVMEKPLGEAAGLGWQGKHTNLVSRKLGSWFFIGSIFTDMELPPDEGESTIAAPAGHASTSARRTPFRRPTNSMRAAASRISPSSMPGRSRMRSARQWATGSTAATIAWPPARGTSSRRRQARRNCRRATI
jgi:epoxyqueuosine reductase QueG